MYLSAACPEWARMPPLTATCMLCISCLPAAAAAAGDGADGAGTDELFFDTTGDEPAIFIGLEARLRPEAVRAAIVDFLRFRGLDASAIAQAHVEAVRVPEGRALVSLLQCHSAAATALVLGGDRK